MSIGLLIPKIISFVTLPLLTTYLSVKEYGEYDLILSLMSLIIPIITLQIQQAAFRYLIQDKNYSGRSKCVTNSIGYIIISHFIFLPVLYYLLKMDKNISILICFLVLVQSLYNLIGQIGRGLGKNLIYSYGVIVYSVFNLILLFILLNFMNNNLYAVVLALIISYFASVIFMAIKLRIIDYFKIELLSFNEIKKLLRFSIPIIPSSISLWIVNLSDRIIISLFLGVSFNGIYSVANKIPLLYSSAYSIFNMAWMETASIHSDDDDIKEYYSDLFNKLYRFLIGVLMLLLALSPVIFKVLVNPQYDSAYYQIPLLYVGVFCNSIVSYYAGIYIAMKRTKQIGYSSILGAILNIILNVIFIKYIGLYAASISTAISYFLISIYRAYDINKVIKIKYNFSNIISSMIIFAIMSVLYYQRSILCNLVILIIALVYNIKANGELIEIGIDKIRKKLIKRKINI
ncbi:oligosaccharide flippase family protein [Clostridium saudiense]|uniref:Oligosaccharide flippase family protein n=1 Tax=Clostridium saudiense TaxID=1414720 RepID=A0ABS2FJI7_9CLOT|nr:oligosaccharide flippase family protein [Clostridium saudiense]